MPWNDGAPNERLVLSFAVGDRGGIVVRHSNGQRSEVAVRSPGAVWFARDGEAVAAGEIAFVGDNGELALGALTALFRSRETTAWDRIVSPVVGTLL